MTHHPTTILQYIKHCSNCWLIFILCIANIYCKCITVLLDHGQNIATTKTALLLSWSHQVLSLFGVAAVGYEVSQYFCHNLVLLTYQYCSSSGPWCYFYYPTIVRNPFKHPSQERQMWVQASCEDWTRCPSYESQNFHQYTMALPSLYLQKLSYTKYNKELFYTNVIQEGCNYLPFLLVSGWSLSMTIELTRCLILRGNE